MPLLIPTIPTVLVTGVSGYLGTAVAVNLLSNGLNVRGTVRTEKQGNAFAEAYTQYKDQFSFVVVSSITEEGAFDKAVVGIDYICHTASPVPDMGVAVDHSSTLIPAIQGTTSILRSALLEPKIKAFVLTSSVASVRDFKKPPIKGVVLTSDNWNSVTYDEALALPTDAVMTVYAASKSLAEKAAWEFMTVNKPTFTLTTILPTWCLGTSYEPGVKFVSDLRSSSGMTAGWCIDKPSLPTGPAVFFKYVSIDDVARAHCQAVLRPETAGKRYLLVGGSASLTQVTYLLRKNFPSQLHRIAPAESEEIPEPYGLDGTPAESAFGFTYQTLEETVISWGNQVFSLTP